MHDVIIHNDTWQQTEYSVGGGGAQATEVGRDPRKCEIGWREVQYLGYHLQGRQVCQQVENTGLSVV